MGKPRFVLLLLSICALVILAAWRASTPNPSVKLTFVGFTNEIVHTQFESSEVTLLIPMAVLKLEKS